MLGHDSSYRGKVTKIYDKVGRNFQYDIKWDDGRSIGKMITDVLLTADYDPNDLLKKIL